MWSKLLNDIKQSSIGCNNFHRLMEIVLSDERGNYRVSHSFQQERKTLNQLTILLKQFYNLTKETDYTMAICKGDQRPDLSEKGNEIYEQFLDLVDFLNRNQDYINDRKNNSLVNDQYKTLKKQTLKNLFDFGGIFYKWIDNKGKVKIINPGEQAKGTGITYLKLNQDLIDCIEKSDKEVNIYLSKVIAKFFIFSSSVIIKFFIDEEIINMNINEIDNKIYTLTLAYHGLQNNSWINFELAKQAYLDLHFNRQALQRVIQVFKQYSKSTKENMKGNGRIDWGNSVNQTDSAFTFLSLTPGYELSKKSISCRLFGKSLDKAERLRRSNKPKNEYFEQHNIDKTVYKTYELHHIYPLALAMSKEEFELIDDWKNLILISPNNHALFPKRNNHITYISGINGEKIEIKSIVDEKSKYEFLNGEDVAYDQEKNGVMIQYNKLLNNI